MADIVLGLVAVGVGLLLCLRGAVVLRVLITLWASVVGFATGAGLVAATTGDSFLAGALALAVAAAAGLLFGAVAYAFFVVAILIAMAAFGFTLGTDLMVALGVSWSWLIVLVGVVTGLALGAAAVAADLPVVVLVALSAFSGSSLALTGVLFLTGTLDSSDLVEASTTAVLRDTWWWWLAYVGLGVAGVVVQVRQLDRWRASVHEQWAGQQPPAGVAA
ncbi:DUF4203 domain-containing protein [Nocardioides sp. zg-1308]|uniref:DUF4203 domain-containing protein n=1 Tax=Nocardioides renjunii TaxID=3095075 RepID=A0ABU5KAQ7_9ACTN|nr:MULTISPECIES: DUF4203 domain-containing protein [unclassified Nocardioides]MDZ5662046.1 hypothetical protein [Nocardioides sp. S-58]NPD06246.1 DUF4203 domain-containing protein [Nocardioides sp. zg-1308]WQQ24285.1 hypothetical protein SHK17_09910 [Nocardioides sp. S-34]